jgi:hypothetical protein
LNYFLGFCVSFATLRFIKILRFNKSIIVFFIAFKQSLNELVSLGFIFMILWTSFVQVFYLLLNDQSVQFASLLDSMSACFQMMLGQFNAGIFSPDAGSFLRPILFVIFNISIVFVMINVMITILNEHYQTARLSCELDIEDPELYNYFRSLLNSKVCFVKTKKDDVKTDIYMSYFESLLYRFDEYLERIKIVDSNFF